MALDSELRHEPSGMYVSRIGFVNVADRAQRCTCEGFRERRVSLFQEGDGHRFGHVCGIWAVGSAKALAEENVGFAEGLPLSAGRSGVEFWWYKQIEIEAEDEAIGCAALATFLVS